MESQFDIRKYDKKFIELQQRREEKEREREFVHYQKTTRRKRRQFVTPELIKKIKTLTRETHFTQDQIAKILGCSQATVSRYYGVKKERISDVRT